MRTAALGVALLVAAPAASGAAPVCEPGKGYVAADTAQQLNEEFLGKLKGAGIGTVIRYYDWADETLPGKTLTAREVALIAKSDMSVAVIFQHNNDCLCTFMRKGRGARDAKRALELAKSFSQPAGSAIYFGVDGVDAQFLTLLAATDLPSGEPQAKKARPALRARLLRGSRDGDEVLRLQGGRLRKRVGLLLPARRTAGGAVLAGECDKLARIRTVCRHQQMGLEAALADAEGGLFRH